MKPLSNWFFSKRYDEIRMTDIAAVANVGRSTLYQHYPDKDAILLANMDWVLNGLLQTTDGPSAENQVTTVLDHIWQHRPQARRLLFGTTGEKNWKPPWRALSLGSFIRTDRTPCQPSLPPTRLPLPSFQPCEPGCGGGVVFTFEPCEWPLPDIIGPDRAPVTAPVAAVRLRSR
ncbi:TetR/AcrR family transcriptional regulator [Roseibium salinum]|nr:TetR/AcrR family transcriptional regulator [Roseibium salinum]